MCLPAMAVTMVGIKSDRVHYTEQNQDSIKQTQYSSLSQKKSYSVA